MKFLTIATALCAAAFAAETEENVPEGYIDLHSLPEYSDTSYLAANNARVP